MEETRSKPALSTSSLCHITFGHTWSPTSRNQFCSAKCRRVRFQLRFINFNLLHRDEVSFTSCFLALGAARKYETDPTHQDQLFYTFSAAFASPMALSSFLNGVPVADVTAPGSINVSAVQSSLRDFFFAAISRAAVSKSNAHIAYLALKFVRQRLLKATTPSTHVIQIIEAMLTDTEVREVNLNLLRLHAEIITVVDSLIDLYVPNAVHAVFVHARSSVSCSR